MFRIKTCAPDSSLLSSIARCWDYDGAALVTAHFIEWNWLDRVIERHLLCYLPIASWQSVQHVFDKRRWGTLGSFYLDYHKSTQMLPRRKQNKNLNFKINKWRRKFKTKPKFDIGIPIKLSIAHEFVINYLEPSKIENIEFAKTFKRIQSPLFLINNSINCYQPLSNSFSWKSTFSPSIVGCLVMFKRNFAPKNVYNAIGKYWEIASNYVNFNYEYMCG